MKSGEYSFFGRVIKRSCSHITFRVFRFLGDSSCRKINIEMTNCNRKLTLSGLEADSSVSHLRRLLSSCSSTWSSLIVEGILYFPNHCTSVSLMKTWTWNSRSITTYNLILGFGKWTKWPIKSDSSFISIVQYLSRAFSLSLSSLKVVNLFLSLWFCSSTTLWSIAFWIAASSLLHLFESGDSLEEIVLAER